MAGMTVQRPGMVIGDTAPLFVVDILSLMMGILIVVAVRQTTFGARMGKHLILISVGFIMICLNHMLDTLWTHEHFEGHLILGSSAPEVVMHSGNLIGFALICLGFYTASRATRRPATIAKPPLPIANIVLPDATEGTTS